MAFQEEIVTIKLDSSAFEKELKALQKKPEVSELKVKARLVKNSVAALIRSFETLGASVKVKAKIADLKSLQTSLDAFKGKITVDAIVDFTKAVTQIENFKSTKDVFISAKLASDSKTAFDRDLKDLTQQVFKTVRLVLNQDSYQQAISQIDQEVENDKTLKIKVTKKDGELQSLIKNLDNLPASQEVDVAVNVDQKQLDKLQTDLKSLASPNPKSVQVNVNTDRTELDRLKSDLEGVKDTQDKTVNLKVNQAELTEAQKKLEALDRPRNVELTVSIPETKLEFKDVDSDVAAQISKSIEKAQKGLARKTPVTLSTLNNYVTELQAALASLKGTDNVDLFNGAIAQLQIIEKRLESIKKSSVNLDIPAKKTAPSNPKNSLDRVKTQLNEAATVKVQSTLDPQSLSTVLNEIESYSPTIQVGVELDPKKVAALPQTKLPDLDPVPVSINPDLNETKSSEAIAALKTKVETAITELKTYISNGLSSAVDSGLKNQKDGNKVTVNLDLQGLEGVTKILSSFKELEDFGTLKINDALDKLIAKSKVVDAWVKAAQGYAIKIAINFAEVEPEKLRELVLDIQKRIDKVEVHVALALTADAITALKTAISAITLDPLPLEVNLDTTKLYAAIDECIAEVNKKMARLPIDLNKDVIDTSLATLIADIKQKEATLPINGDRTLIDNQIEAVIAYAQAAKAILVLSLNDSRFLTELEDLKRRVSEDVAKLAVEIKSVDSGELSTEVSDAVVEGLKEISDADLKQLKRQISTAKGIATTADKPETQSSYAKSVLKQIEKLQAAKAQLSGTGNDDVEQDLDATLTRLIAALTKLGGSLGEAQFQVEKSEVTSQKSDKEISEIRNLKSEISKQRQPQTVDLYKNMGMDATPEIQNLVTQIARLVAVNKGLGDVWNDSMTPPVFTQGLHNVPLARGAAFKDGSGIALRSDVAEFLTGTEGAFKDSFETVVHEIVHVMQKLSRDLGRDYEYNTQPQTVRERNLIRETESNQFYRTQNKLTNGETFQVEHDANLTAHRESAQIAEQLGINLYSAIDPAKKLAAHLKALDTAFNNTPKIIKRVIEVQGAEAGAAEIDRSIKAAGEMANIRQDISSRSSTPLNNIGDADFQRSDEDNSSVEDYLGRLHNMRLFLEEANQKKTTITDPAKAEANEKSIKSLQDTISYLLKKLKEAGVDRDEAEKRSRHPTTNTNLPKSAPAQNQNNSNPVAQKQPAQPAKPAQTAKPAQAPAQTATNSKGNASKTSNKNPQPDPDLATLEALEDLSSVNIEQIINEYEEYNKELDDTLKKIQEQRQAVKKSNASAQQSAQAAKSPAKQSSPTTSGTAPASSSTNNSEKDLYDPWLSDDTPESKRTAKSTDNSNKDKSSNPPMSSSPKQAKRKSRSSTLTTEELTEKLETVKQSFYKFEQDYKDAGRELKAAKAKNSTATPEEIQDLKQKGENLAKRKAKLTEKRRKLEDLIEAAERYYGNTTETNNRNRTKKTNAQSNLIDTQAKVTADKGEAQVNKTKQQTETEKARTTGVTNESAARVNNTNSRTAQQDLDAIQRREFAAEADRLKLVKQGLLNDLQALKNKKQNASNLAQILKDKKEIELKILRIADAELKLKQRQLALDEAVQTSPDRITQSSEKTTQAQERTKQAIEGTTQALTKTQMLEEQLRQLIAKGAGGSSGGGGGGGGSTNVAGASGGMPDEEAVAQFRARVAQIQAQLVQEAEKDLTAAQIAANDALDEARRVANTQATKKTIQDKDLDVQLKLLRVDQAAVALAQRQLALAESSAMSEDKIARSKYALLQAQQRVAAAELRLANANLDSQLKAQRLTINEQRIAAGVRREQRELAPRSYGATGGSKSQINAERRLPINLGLNILEASNNRLGNLARIFIDLQEGIQSASFEGETFAQTFNRIKTPIAIIGIIGAMASLVAITAPAVIAIQKLEKSLTAFGKQNEFADSLKLSKELATEYGASLTIVASELSRFKTSLADSSIADQSNSIFESLVKYGSTVGASQDELSRGLVALGQIASKGKVSLEELNGQLSEAIPGASSIAAKALGITKAELFDMAQAGSLLSDTFLPKFRDELERVNKAQEIFGKSTLSQAFGKLKESLIIQGLDKTTGAIDLLTSAFEGLANFVNDGMPVPFNLLGEAGLQLSTILNASVTASFIYLMSKAQPLIRVLKLLQIPFLINARNAAILTDQTIGLTLAQRQAYISSMRLQFGFKAMIASAAPLIATFAALQIAFGVLNELDGGDFFRETNKQFDETAKNVEKLKVTILKNLAEIQNAQNKGNPDDKPNPFQNISQAEQEQAQADYKKKSQPGKLLAETSLDYQRFRDMFRSQDDPSKRNFKGNVFRRILPFQSVKKQNEEDIYDRNANVNAIRQEDVDSTLKAADKINAKLSEIVNNKALLDKFAADVVSLDNINNTISSLGLVAKSFEEGRLEADQLQATLLRIGVPQELIPADLGQGINDAAQDSRELDSIFASLASRKDVLKQAIAAGDPELIRQYIAQLEIYRAGVEKNSDNYKEFTERINLANTALLKLENTLKNQKVAQDKVNEALSKYNSIKAENDGVVDLATTLAEVALKQEALNKGVISNSSLSLQNMQIKARAHTLRMAQIKEEQKALSGLTMNLKFEDAFAIKNVIKDDSLFKDQEDGTVSFAIDRASVTQLDAILLKTEGLITDSVKKSIEAFRNESSNLNLAYAQQQSGLLDIQLEVREKVAEANKDFAEAMENFGSETKELTKSFIETFAEGILSINREITDLSNDLKKLKITNAGKQFDNALRRFALNATGDLDESVLDNIRLRKEMEMESAIAEIDFQSESERIANSFTDGVNEIAKAFADYLAEFKKLQQDLIKARQELASSGGNTAAANITPDLSSFDQNKSKLNQTVGEAVKTNAIPDSKALIKSSELVGKEAKKQTELANKQIAGQAATGASVKSQTVSMKAGHAAIVDTSNMNVDESTAQLAVLIQMRNLLGKASTSPNASQATGNTTSISAAISSGQGVVNVPTNTVPGGQGNLPSPPPVPEPFTKTPLGNLKSDIIALRRAIVGKESSGDYTAVNEDTGASGYGQVMPANIPSWTREALGRSLTRSEFLANPEAQLMTIEFKLNEFLQQELAAGNPLDLAVRRVASIWYSGQADKYNNTTKLGKYPSVDAYTKDALSRFKTEKASLKSEASSATQTSNVQAVPAPAQNTNQKVMNFTEALGIARQISAYVVENTKALQDLTNIKTDINVETNKVGTAANLEAKALKIEENNKVKIDNADGIAEAIKPELPKYEQQARDNLKDQLAELNNLENEIAPALKQIAQFENNISNLFANDSGLSIEESVISITEQLDKIAQIKNDPNFKEIQKILAEEKKLAEILLKIEEYGLKRADSYNKKAADFKVEQKVEEAKKQLDDPYINPVQKIQLEKNLKLSEQALDFGKKVKEEFDRIMKENPAMAYSDAWAIATAKVRNSFEDELANLAASADSVKNKLKESFKDVVVDMFSIDFADTSKTFSEKIFAVFNDVLRNLQTWAAGKLGEVLIDALNKGSSNKKNRKSVDDFSEGLNGVNDLMPFPKKIEDKGDPDRKNKANPWGNIASAIDDADFSFSDFRIPKFDPKKGGSGEWMNLPAGAIGALGSTVSSQARSSGDSGLSKLKPWLGLAASAASSFGGGWGQVGASILGAFMADGGEVGTGFAFNSIANLLETERIKSNGRTPVLTALHMGEHVLSTKNKDAQAFQAMQQNGVWDAVKSASGYASGGSVGLMSSNMRMNQLFKSDNSQTKTINNVSNFNFTATNDQLIQRTEAQIQSRKNSYL